MLKDFDKQLMDLLESTNHSEDHSIIKRREHVYKAIFGKQYKSDPKIPYYLTEHDMDVLLEKIKENQNVEGPIKEFLKKRQKEIEPDATNERRDSLKSVNEKHLQTEFDGIIQHLKRHKKDYWDIIKGYEKF